MANQYLGLSFNQVNVFLVAARFENFTKAAEALNMAQSAVSRSISTMEETLGIILFVRHQRRIHLTNAGKFLYSEFDALSKEMGNVMDKAYQIQNNQFNNLSVSSWNILANNQILMPIVHEFQRKHPNVNVTVEIMDPFIEMDQLIQGGYDVGIVAAAWASYLKKNGVICKVIYEDIPHIMLSERHPLYFVEEDNIEALLQSPIVAISDPKRLYINWLHNTLNTLQLPHGDITYVTNTDTVAAMIENGTHIFLGNRHAHFHSANKIRSVPMTALPPVSGIALAYREDNENPFISKFIDQIRTSGWPE